MWTGRRLASDENTYGNLKASSGLPPVKGAAGERRQALNPMSKNTPAATQLKRQQQQQAPMAAGNKSGEASAKPRRALGEITNRVKGSSSSGSSSKPSALGQGVELWKPVEAPPSRQQQHLPMLKKGPASSSVEGLRSAVEAMRLVEEEDDVESVEFAAGRLGDEEDALLAARDEEDSVGEVAVWKGGEEEMRDLLLDEEDDEGGLLKVKDDEDLGLWDGLEEFLGDDEEEEGRRWKKAEEEEEEDWGGVICDVAISEEEEEGPRGKA